MFFSFKRSASHFLFLFQNSQLVFLLTRVEISKSCNFNPVWDLMVLFIISDKPHIFHKYYQSFIYKTECFKHKGSTEIPVSTLIYLRTLSSSKKSFLHGERWLDLYHANHYQCLNIIRRVTLNGYWNTLINKTLTKRYIFVLLYLILYISTYTAVFYLVWSLYFILYEICLFWFFFFLGNLPDRLWYWYHYLVYITLYL